MASRPLSVYAAALALIAAVLVHAALFLNFAPPGRVGWAQLLFAVVLFAILIWAILAGHRLGWLWGRYLTAFLALLQLIAVVFARIKGGVSTRLFALVLAGEVLPLLGAAWALGRSEAVAFFGLVCPICRTPVKRGADLFFKRARCPKCSHVW